MDAAAPLEITTTDTGLRLVGELDTHTAPSLQAALADLGGERVVIDMAGVEFVDSSGLRVLIQSHQQADEAGRAVVLSRPSNAVRRLLEISGLEGYLNVD